MEQLRSSPILEDVLWSIDGIPVEDLPIVWDDAWPYLRAAIERFPAIPDRLGEGEILQDLIARKRQLWTAWDFENERITGALLSQIVHDKRIPDKTLCSIPLMGGSRFNDGWGDTMWITIKAWARANDCEAIIIAGRKGWQRLYGFVDFGLTDEGIPVMIRTLGDER